MTLGRLSGLLHRRVAFFVSAKILLSLVLLVAAMDITVNVTQFQAEHGASINYSNNLIAVDLGVSKIASTTLNQGIACGSSVSNVTFASGPVQANTNLTASDYAYTIQVNTTGTTPAVSCFTVTLTMIASGNTSMSVLKLATGPTPVANETINCIFDIGSSLPPSPYSYSVSVQ